MILPCGSKKIWAKHTPAGPTAARLAYTGAPFTVNRRYAEGVGDRWVILSAKYGFMDPDDLIPEPYEVTFKRRDTNPVPFDTLQQQVQEQGLAQFGQVIALGGKEYQAAINAALGNLLPATAADVAAVSKDLGYENLPLRGQNAYTLYKGTDSPAAPQGYKGRIGLYEVFTVTQAIQDLILKRSTSTEIQKVAEQEGMVNMREDGYLKALAGYTTITEVNRVATADSA